MSEQETILNYSRATPIKDLVLGDTQNKNEQSPFTKSKKSEMLKGNIKDLVLVDSPNKNTQSPSKRKIIEMLEVKFKDLVIGDSPNKNTQSPSPKRKKSDLLKSPSKMSMENILSYYDKYSSSRKNEIIRYLHEGRYSKFDPIVSDWGCQFRAVYLSYVFNQMEMEKLECTGLEGINLLKHFSDCLFLTETSKLANLNKEHDKGTDIFEDFTLFVTDEEVFPPDFIRFFKENSLDISRNGRVKFYALIKKNVATTGIDIVLRLVNQSEHPNKDKFWERLLHPGEISFGRNTHVPYISAYDCGLLSLELLSALKLDFIVSIRRIVNNYGKIYQEGPAILFYEYKNGIHFFKKYPPKYKMYKSFPKIILYSVKVNGYESTYSKFSFYKEDSFQQFKNGFIKEVDLKSILLEIFAIHPQFIQDKASLTYKNIDYFNQSFEENRKRGLKSHIVCGTHPCSMTSTDSFKESVPLKVLHIRVSSLMESLEKGIYPDPGCDCSNCSVQ